MLRFGIFEFLIVLNFWKKQKIWTFEMLQFWNFEFLNVWSFETLFFEQISFVLISEFWNVGILKCSCFFLNWNSDKLYFLVFDVFQFLNFGILKSWRHKMEILFLIKKRNQIWKVYVFFVFVFIFLNFEILKCWNLKS